MRNYFNAIVIYKNRPDEEVEIIFKVGEVDTLDDIHVDEYVGSQKELETIKTQGHPDFTLVKYWKEPAPKVEQSLETLLEPAKTMVAQNIMDWLEHRK